MNLQHNNPNNKPPPQRPKMASGSGGRRADYGEEFVERLRKDRFRKAYILVNGVNSSEEEDEELCIDEEDDEIASFAMDPPPRPSSTHSSRRAPSVAASASYSHRVGGAYGFDARDLYFFGVLSELTDKLTPEKAARLIARNPPPAEYRSLVSIERVAYLLYYSLYGRYLSIGKYHNVFNREFYKYTSAGATERLAFLKICRHTLEEWKRRALEQSKRAYKASQKHLFSDERATPDSRVSDRPSMEESEDLTSLDSLAKELVFYRTPHMPIRFARGGRLIYVNPDRGMSTVCVEDLKRFYKDREGRRYVELLESFKGPMLIGHTPPQSPLLFIQCQIDRVLQSDVYRANPSSGDANDCLLIWCLLEMLIRQHGKVTGPDLARLLCSNQPYSSITPLSHQSFLKSNATAAGASVRTGSVSRQDSGETELLAVEIDSSAALDRVTRFLLGGHIDEAIESAINDGLLFDALLLAHRLFRNDSRRLEAIVARLMAHRSPQHPMTTLLSVAADQPVPLLSNLTTSDTNGWRSHMAIVLANLNTPTAMNAVYQLGLALARKEFNSAADFCFLAVNLLAGFECFQRPHETDEQGAPHRRHIRLISATLPDDEANSFSTRFGWSILDYQATELFDYASRLANPNSATALSKSPYYNRARQEYTQLLDELGGFSYAVELYRAGKTSLDQRKTPSPPLRSSITPLASVPTAINDPPNKFATRSQNQRATSPEQFTSSITPRSSIPTDHGTHYQETDYHAQYEEEELAPPPLLPIHQPKAQKPIMPSYQQPIAQQQLPLFQPHIPLAAQVVEQHRQQQQQQQRPERSVSPVQQHHRPPSPLTKSFPTMQQPQSGGVGTPPPNANRPFALPSTMPPFPNQEPIIDEQPMLAVHTVTSSAIARPTEAKKSTQVDPVGKEESTNKGDGSKGGFLRGFFSKIKSQTAGGGNEMRLPEDKNPKIVWDPQKGKYVDQEQDDRPQEELAPPPIMPSFQPQVVEQQQQRPAQSVSPPTEQQRQQSPSPIQFPQIPSSSAPPPAPSGRPFQGRARYANAWNS